MALFLSAFAFVSCDKDEKDDLTEKESSNKNQGGLEERVDPSTVLTLSQQQAVFKQAVSNLGQQIDFTNLAQTLSTYLTENEVDLDSDLAIDTLSAQDPALGTKLNALRQLLYSDEDISFDFDNLYFEADIALKDSIIIDSSEYKTYKRWYNIVDESELDEEDLAYLISLIEYDTVAIPILLDINHEADQFKINFHTKDHNVITFCLRGQNDSESRITVTDTVKVATHDVTLPDSLNYSLIVNGDTLICLNAGYSTDFKIDVKGAEKSNGKFKMSDLYFNGSSLSSNVDVTSDIYSLTTKATYGNEKGLNLSFVSRISGEEALSGILNIKGLNNSSTNWVEGGDILAWAMDKNYFKGIDFNVNVFKDEIKMHLSAENPFEQEIMALFALLISSDEGDDEGEGGDDDGEGDGDDEGGNVVTAAQMNQMVDKFNEVFKGEIYFKDYSKPLALLKLVYEPPTRAVVNVSTIFKGFIANFEKYGLKLGIETYDDEGIRTFVSFKEYFGEEDFYKAFAAQIKEKYASAFGPLLTAIKNKKEKGSLLSK